MPTEAKTTKTAQINLLVRDLKKAHIQEMKKPKAPPIKRERPISHNGLPNIVQTEKESPVAIVLAIWNKTAKRIKAEASSKATVGRRVSTTGPWALYCLTTIKVAAGAVAAAMAAKERIKGQLMASGLKIWAMPKPISTTTEAIKDSKIVIQMTFLPTRFKALALKEEPMEKAMKPRAMLLTQPSLLTNE